MQERRYEEMQGSHFKQLLLYLYTDTSILMWISIALLMTAGTFIPLPTPVRNNLTNSKEDQSGHTNAKNRGK